MTVMVEGKVEKPEPNTWRKRTNLKKCFISYKTITIIIGLSLLALVYVIYIKTLHPVYIHFDKMIPQETVEEPEYVCNSAECIHTASRVLNYMDRNKDPCVNFYDFACGNFAEGTNIPYRNESSPFLKYLIEEQLINVIERPIQNDEPHPFQLVKKLYGACMDEERIEERGLNTMKNILNNLGGWPVLVGDSWMEDNFNWKECDYSLYKHGYQSYFWDVFSNNSIILDTPYLLITESGSENFESYFNYMVDVAVLFGADRETAETELKESFELELQLSKVHVNYSNFDIRMTITQLETKFPNIPWLEYINNLLAPDNQVTEDETITVTSLDIITNIEAIISRTPKRVQANYVMWRVVADSVKFLTHDLRRRKSEFKTFEMEYANERRKECLYESKARLHIATSAMYVNKYFNEKVNQKAKQMVTDIKLEFSKILRNVDWIDETTRKYSLETLGSMTSDIGYTEELIDMAILEDYYKDLKLDTDDYLLSILKANAFRIRLSYQNLRQRLDKNDWKLNIYADNYRAQYISFFNKLRVPAGSLQGIFFDVDRPSYMNYASMGFIISESFTNAFSKFQIYFDDIGNMVDETWSQNETISGFNDKLQCFIDRYRKLYSELEWELEIDELDIPSKIIADNGGIEMAYFAYNAMLEGNGLEPKLPGLNYTPRQMFWISAANTICSAYREDDGNSAYIPAKWRVLGAMSNSKCFAQDFHCPAGSPMNPSKTCQFW